MIETKMDPLEASFAAMEEPAHEEAEEEQAAEASAVEAIAESVAGIKSWMDAHAVSPARPVLEAAAATPRRQSDFAARYLRRGIEAGLEMKAFEGTSPAAGARPSHGSPRGGRRHRLRLDTPQPPRLGVDRRRRSAAGRGRRALGGDDHSRHRVAASLRDPKRGLSLRNRRPDRRRVGGGDELPARDRPGRCARPFGTARRAPVRALRRSS